MINSVLSLNLMPTGGRRNIPQKRNGASDKLRSSPRLTRESFFLTPPTTWDASALTLAIHPKEPLGTDPCRGAAVGSAKHGGNAGGGPFVPPVPQNARLAPLREPKLRCCRVLRFCKARAASAQPPRHPQVPQERLSNSLFHRLQKSGRVFLISISVGTEKSFYLVLVQNWKKFRDAYVSGTSMEFK